MNESQAVRQMPIYKCHKEVWALKIGAILGQSETGEGAWIYAADEEFGKFFVDSNYLQKHKPQPDGYFVQYADGYQSFSPAKAFEDGYTKMPQTLHERLHQERMQLDERRQKLDEFLESNDADISPHEAIRLFKQSEIMKQYSDVLYERIMAMGDSE